MEQPIDEARVGLGEHNMQWYVMFEILNSSKNI